MSAPPSDKRVLVTGAAGFIGRWSVPPLLAAGYEVHAVVRPRGRAVPAQLQGALIHCAELLDTTVVQALMGSVRPSHLLHFAWIATPGVYWTSAENARWLAAGTRLLHSFAFHGGTRAVMAGTCAEYDWSQAALCVEGVSPLADAGGGSLTAYASAKLAMHRTLQDFAAANGLSSAWGRIFFQYGPDEHPNRLVSSVILHLLRGQAAPCTHGRQVRTFMHAADVGGAFAALLDSEVRGPVNIGSAQRVSIAELLGKIGSQIGRSELLRLGARDTPAAEPPLLIPDVLRLWDEVGWRPRFDLDAGLVDTIDWWRGQLAGEPVLQAR